VCWECVPGLPGVPDLGIHAGQRGEDAAGTPQGELPASPWGPCRPPQGCRGWFRGGQLGTWCRPACCPAVPGGQGRGTARGRPEQGANGLVSQPDTRPRARDGRCREAVPPGPNGALRRSLRDEAVPSTFLGDTRPVRPSASVSAGDWCDGIVGMCLSTGRSRLNGLVCDGIRAEHVCRHNHRFPLVIAGFLLSPLPSHPCDSKTAPSALRDGILGHGVG